MYDIDCNFTKILDVTGAYCPVPIISTKKEMSKLTTGDSLLVKVTDPSYAIDCKVFTNVHGHKLLNVWQDGDHHFYLIEKG